jgi:pantetheine-phosphate adenylyltransferase
VGQIDRRQRFQVIAQQPAKLFVVVNQQQPDYLNNPPADSQGFGLRARIEDYTLSMPPVVAIYPGSFDPITNGHLDLIERGSRLFDRLIVAVLHNEGKQALFSVNERVEMLREVVAHIGNVEVDCFGGLLVNYASGRGARVILRGIRAISDYEYELQMALMNRRLEDTIETVFLMAGEANSFVSSRLVKEVAGLGGDIRRFVPASVATRLGARLERTDRENRKS